MTAQQFDLLTVMIDLYKKWSNECFGIFNPLLRLDKTFV